MVANPELPKPAAAGNLVVLADAPLIHPELGLTVVRYEVTAAEYDVQPEWHKYAIAASKSPDKDVLYGVDIGVATTDFVNFPGRIDTRVLGWHFPGKQVRVDMEVQPGGDLTPERREKLLWQTCGILALLAEHQKERVAK
jgi:hypothetical protein